MKIIQREQSILGESGETRDEATQSAWNRSHWTKGKPVRSLADSIVAMRWAYLRASKEAATDSAKNLFNLMADRAAYNYDRAGYNPEQVLRIAVAQLTSTPYTMSEVKSLLAELQASRNAKPARRKSGGNYSPAPVPAPDASAASGAPWYEQFTGSLPTWAPYAAGGTALVILLVALMPRRQYVAASTPSTVVVKS